MAVVAVVAVEAAAAAAAAAVVVVILPVCGRSSFASMRNPGRLLRPSPGAGKLDLNKSMIQVLSKLKFRKALKHGRVLVRFLASLGRPLGSLPLDLLPLGLV